MKYAKYESDYSKGHKATEKDKHAPGQSQQKDRRDSKIPMDRPFDERKR